MVDPLFQVHRLNDDGLKKAAEIASAFDNLLRGLQPLMPLSCRETAIVRTKLEEACFFAKKAMANDPANQQVNK